MLNNHILTKLLLLILIARPSLQADWTPPVNISSKAVTSDNSQVAIDNNNNIVAVWLAANSDQGKHDFIQAATTHFNTRWFSALTLSDQTHDANEPHVNITNKGTAVAIWSFYHNNGQSTIQSSSLSFSLNRWSQPINIFPLAFDANEPQLAIDSNGNTLAIWHLFPTLIQSAVLPFGNNKWKNLKTLSNSGINEHPEVAIGGKGNAVAVWDDFGVEAAKLKNLSSDWTNSHTISHEQETLFPTFDTPQIASDSNGNTVAIWEVFENGNYVIESSTLPFGASKWSEPIIVSGNKTDSLNPRIAVDGEGNAYAVWELLGDKTVIQTAVLKFGTNRWSKPINLSITEKNSFEPEIAVDPFGNAVAVWETDAPNGTIVEAAILPFVKKTWSPPRLLSNKGSGNFSPQVAINHSGNIVVTWTHVEKLGFGIIQASKGKKLFPPLSPTNFRGTRLENEFATQTLFIDHLTWKPSSDPSVLGYLLFDGDKLIAKIPAKGPFVFDVPNRCKDRTYTYSLVAFNANSRGEIITIKVAGN